MRSYLFVAFWWFVVILLYHFEVYFSSFFGSYHFSTDRKFVLGHFCFEANGFAHDTNSAEEFRQCFLLKNAMIFGMII